LEWSRLGTVVSRRVGRAHQRNLIKRRLRDFFRNRRHDFNQPIDLVVVAKPGAAGIDSEQIALELTTVLKKWLDAPPSS
jgi:ribonuclease P protein component